MKRTELHIILVMLLVAIPFFKLLAITYPATIWFYDGTIKNNITHIILDSANRVVLYLDKNRYKTAFWDEVFAITSDEDTIIVTSPKQIPGSSFNLDEEQTFQLLQGIHDGFTAKHYKTFLSSMAISYVSNLALLGQNVVVRNVPNLVNFYYHACSRVKSAKCRNMYELGFQIGLQKRKVIETASGIIIGIYLELLTESAIVSN